MALEESKANPRTRSWFFAVPLISIDSRKKVQDDLVGTIFQLLDSEILELPEEHPTDRFEMAADGPVLKGGS